MAQLVMSGREPVECSSSLDHFCQGSSSTTESSLASLARPQHGFPPAHQNIQPQAAAFTATTSPTPHSPTPPHDTNESSRHTPTSLAFQPKLFDPTQPPPCVRSYVYTEPRPARVPRVCVYTTSRNAPQTANECCAIRSISKPANVYVCGVS